jgi:hypothetical protein
MASTTYRVIQEQPHLGIFTREQIDEAIRAANAILAQREARKKSRSSAKKSQGHRRN